MMPALLVTLAGFMGAGGVALAAASAHAVPNAGLDSAGHMLLFHAAAVLGVTAVLQAGLLWRPLGLVAAFGLALGAILFAGDIALRAFAGHRLRGLQQRELPGVSRRILIGEVVPDDVHDALGGEQRAQSR